MRITRKFYPLILLVLCLPHTAGAAVVRIDQVWHTLDFATSGMSAETTALVDSALLTGIGDEVAPVRYFSMATYTNGIGQNFVIANLPDPRLDQEGNIGASFSDGVFGFLGGVNLGGAARIPLLNGNNLGASAGSMSIALNFKIGPELIWHFPVSGERKYYLQSTNVRYPQTSPVPLPGAIWLFAPALLGLGWLRRHSGRRAAVTS